MATTTPLRQEMRCVHCSRTETPLWRAGPSGPKTLCNACGVRWKKTGSLIPRAKRPSIPPHPPSPSLRKRARPNSSKSSSHHHHHPHPDIPTLPLPAPRPISVFRASDAARARYDSVFSGLMVVHRGPEDAPRTRARTHTTKATAFFGQFSTAASADPGLSAGALDRPGASPPPVEKHEKEREAVYVTEVHAPSPSPSPPPMPRVQRAAEGGGFRLLLAPVIDRNPSSS